MTDQLQEIKTTTNSKSGWTKEQTQRLGKALTFVYDNLKSYGQPLNLKSRVSGWKFVLEEDYTIEQVLSALKVYMKNNQEMPAPADIANILKPEEKKITYGEYCRAKDEWAKEGYTKFSYYADIVREYESDDINKDREPFEITGDMQKLLEVHRAK